MFHRFGGPAIRVFMLVLLAGLATPVFGQLTVTSQRLETTGGSTSSPSRCSRGR